MSVGVLPEARCFHWESASKPALTRCTFRPAPVHGPTSSHSPFHRRRHRHHRARRRYECPAWTRRPSEVTPPSLSSWHTETSSLLTPDSPQSVSASPPRHARPTPSPAALLLARNSLVNSRMSSSAGRGAGEGARGSSTAAAREVKQYLSRTLFPRPASTLHGYASLYRRLTQLPAHRKLQRGPAGPQTESDPNSGAECRDGQIGDPDDRDALEGRVPSPPRVEIHIYVPTAATATPAPAPHEEEGPLTF